MRALALLERGLYAEVMKILFLGDVMGRAGRQAITNRLPGLRADWALDFVVVNGENASAGAGLTPAHAKDLLAAGADCVTLGDHSFDQKDMLQFIETEPRILRPLNYAKGAPGKGARLFTATQGRKILVMQGLGQVFMKRPLTILFGHRCGIACAPFGGGRACFTCGYALRGDVRKDGHGPLVRRAYKFGGGDAHPCANERCADFKQRDCVSDRCGDVRGLRLCYWDGKG